MISTVIAVVGTLLGALVSGLFQHRSAGRTEKVARAEQLRRDQLEAVTALAVAISDHRSAMWVRGDAVVKGDPVDRVRELQTRTHATRSAVTRPLVALRLHVTDPDVRRAADAMVSATYAMRDAYTSPDDLTRARETALQAHDHFVDVAAHYLHATA
ncbi:hypothetical protein PV377_30605 [Streptomyces ipomoeae]|uniref:hypothetical protein n=1 Tax=Streptomyces ipomoeae TaxID=103232 RepID=UPI0029A3833C|nr:hypothetical protein [Streptomyces ipomoeae]MDX2843248.1 hypothetical protein [Streptomyces ipomoeae]